jgi:hypothetical protein
MEFQGMSDTDDYIKTTKKFEKLRQEYLEWVALAGHILTLLRPKDEMGVTAGRKVLGDQLRLGAESAHTCEAKDDPTCLYQFPTRER